ncbi:MBL fold metallo-hydrolase [Desulfuromonas versatilis]|uniref:MBL fold metallo-hydrolase n=1 Tax=Desulfuromonas versatilis TaxID=2802975 RepID=A0ABM8HP50_9BACT|nr:GPMC system MBL fold metallohydrolase [Desulfuromonas versatilis]BCR03405.1 MBL fold metallo-hydrolase [Desulfuromonas versatilis]
MNRRNLKVTILGSGTSTGVPVIGCRCPVCRSQDPRNQRTRCSVLISVGERNVLIDTATDLRQQALREEVDHVDAVLFTHSHADHVHGIDDLRSFNRSSGELMPIFGSAETIGTIRRNFSYIFDDDPDAGYRPRLAPQVVDGPFELFGLRIEPLPLVHGPGRSLGYRVGPFAYLTDCSAIPAESQARLGGIDTLVVDGLRFKPHQSHFSIAQAIEAAANIGARRTLLTHLSHDVDYARHSPLLPEGVELAHDGQRLSFDFAAGDE